MGNNKKKSGSHGAAGGEGEKKKKGSRAFVLKVAMHCSCHGCIDKIRAAVKDITFLQGIESWDQSALETKGELKLVATADPEKLRHRLHKATRKNVDLVFFPSKDKDKQDAASDTDSAAAAQALLLNSLMMQQQGQSQYGQQNAAAWVANNHQILPGGAGGGWNAYPWAVQQLDPYAAYSGGGGAYPYPAPALQWNGHGY